MRHATASAPMYTPPRVVAEDRCAPAIAARILQELEPYLKRAAAHIARDYPAAADDMIQEARIMIWEIDVGRLAQSDAAYFQGMLWRRMLAVYRAEWGGVRKTRERTKDELRGVRIYSFR